MPGIYGIISNKKKLKTSKLFKKFYSYEGSESVNEERYYGDFTYGRSVIPKFLDDRLLFENEEIIIAFEGVCFDVKKGDLISYILNEYRKEGIKLFSEIEGSFSGLFTIRKRAAYI